jgi:hypothetical protein
MLRVLKWTNVSLCTFIVDEFSKLDFDDATTLVKSYLEIRQIVLTDNKAMPRLDTVFHTKASVFIQTDHKSLSFLLLLSRDDAFLLQADVRKSV